jgi:hypothetical protein
MVERKAPLMVSHLAAVMVPQKESELEKDLALSLGWQKGCLRGLKMVH